MKKRWSLIPRKEIRRRRFFSLKSHFSILRLDYSSINWMKFNIQLRLENRNNENIIIPEPFKHGFAKW